MKNLLWLGLVLALALVAGCKEEEESRSSAPADSVTTGYLQTAVNDLGAVTGVATDATSAGSAQGTLSGLYNSYNAMVSYTTAGSAGGGSGIVPYAETVNCALSGSYTWDTTTVTYDNCDGLSGTISWSGDTFTMDITYDFSVFMAGYTGQMTYSGEMTISDTMIAGNLDLAFDYSFDTQGYTGSYTSDMSIAYADVGLDADGCPSSGSMDLEGNYAYEVSGQTGDSPFHITYQFNACGDVTVLY
jgi:hypothetical protein